MFEVPLFAILTIFGQISLFGVITVLLEKSNRPVYSGSKLSFDYYANIGSEYALKMTLPHILNRATMVDQNRLNSLILALVGVRVGIGHVGSSTF